MAKRKKPGVVSDPENYANMMVPHATPDAAQAAWTAFWEDVYALRKKHRIAQAVVVGEVRFLQDDTPMGIHVIGAMGDPESVLRMLATGYGQMKAKHDADLAALANPVKPDDILPTPETP